MLTTTAEKWVKEGHSRITPLVEYIVEICSRPKEDKFNIKDNSDFERIQRYHIDILRYL